MWKERGGKEELHKEGLNHVGGEIGRRMKAKDYCTQINRRTYKHMHTHTSPCLPSNSAGPTPTMIIDMGRDAAWKRVEGDRIGASKAGGKEASFFFFPPSCYLKCRRPSVKPPKTPPPPENYQLRVHGTEAQRRISAPLLEPAGLMHSLVRASSGEFSNYMQTFCLNLLKLHSSKMSSSTSSAALSGSRTAALHRNIVY